MLFDKDILQILDIYISERISNDEVADAFYYFSLHLIADSLTDFSKLMSGLGQSLNLKFRSTKCSE